MTSNLNQTLQNKYPNLEISVLKYSDAMRDNEKLRIDSEFFKSEYIKLDLILSKLYCRELSEITKSIRKGIFDISPMYYQDSGIPFLRVQNIQNSFLDKSNCVFISEEYSRNEYKTQLEYGDLALSKVGSIGRFCFITETVNTSQNVTSIKVNKKEINSHYLFTFLISKFGQKQFERKQSQQVQSKLELEDIRKVIVPLFPIEFQQQIEQMVRESHECLEQSKDLYREAEVLLYQELGLNSQNPLATIAPVSQSLNFSVRTLKESLHTTGRLDSEYYQQKYDEIERLIYQFPVIKLGDLVEYPISSGATPKSGGDAYTEDENGILFLRAVDLKNGEVDLNNAIKIKPEIHNGLLKRTKILPDDILFSIAGTIGRTAIYNHTVEANINQALSIIRFSEDKEINKLYFVTFFNSEFGQVYLEKYARQGLQTNLNLSEVANLEIPKINPQTQTQIAEKIKQSFALRVRANELLQSAKTKVETAIEQA